MTDSGAVRQKALKEINWYGSVTAGLPVTSGLQVYARVESLAHRLLENGVLQVNAVIKLFAVPGSGKKNGCFGQNGQPAVCFTGRVDTSTFIKLRPVKGPQDILSIRHRIKVEKTTARPGRISVIGSLKIEVEYLSPVSLNGRVTVFATGQPLKDAAIKVLDMNEERVLHETATGADGTYIFEGIETGTFLVHAEAEGFEPQEQIAVIMLQDTVNFVLHRRASEQKDAV
ncbi:carboxypeptidase-like regulatory domain-containing protein [Desulfotomaculum copahuensis]|uniref:carboxypeptidase-like regulatory domain-containing protein n=1 Tax=Desulfotomaculum copahuensis TaxID=1838280 RepID=UPI000AF8B7CD|nr:carboxypeptidase-like regulatory domain-containing protein [Desulfotomaculum copahuensis]